MAPKKPNKINKKDIAMSAEQQAVPTSDPFYALIYCRVSDKKQRTDGHGLESQEHRCRQHAKERG